MPEPRKSAEAAIDDVDLCRAELYLLLARLLAGPPSDALLAWVRGLQGGGGEIGAASDALAAAARAHSFEAIRDHYQSLFVGMTAGELVPCASVYLTGLVYDKPLVAVRQDMVRLGIARDPGLSEPEDHISPLCEMMAGLILGHFSDAPAALEEQYRFFESHLAPWAPRLFAELQGVDSSFYAAIGSLGARFIAIETKAFALAS